MRNDTVPTEVIREAVRLACRAPSLHNTQPWLWQVDGRTVELFLDKDRVLHGTDHLGGLPCLLAAPCWTTSEWRWQAPDARPVSNESLTATIHSCSRDSTSLPRSA